MEIKYLSGTLAQENGTVLLMVLLIVSILVVVAIEGFRSTQVDISSAYIFAHGLEAGNINQSLLEHARAILAYDSTQNDFDHYQEIWGNPQKQNKVTYPTHSRGSFALKIIDENSKLPVNYLAAHSKSRSDKDSANQNQQIYQKILKRVLINKPFNLEEKKADQIIKAMVAWIGNSRQKQKDKQKNKDSIKNNAEFIENTNNTKGAPMSFISELLLVKGITEELFYGNSTQPGLKDLLSAHSDKGKININTASPYLLQAMVPDSVHRDTAREFARSMQAYREDSMHWEFLNQLHWYKDKMPGYNDIQLPTALISTSSNYFAVQANATIGDICGHVFAYIYREPVRLENKSNQKSKPAKLKTIFQEYY